MPAREAAERFVEEMFPDCQAAFLAGSASRGEETDTSDLDIVVFDSRSPGYRESFFRYGWGIECFVHSEESYLRQFAADREMGRPILARMLAEGVVIRDKGLADRLKREALEFLRDGPVPLSAEYIQASRYFIFDLLDDFVDAKSEEEALLTVNTLSVQLADFILRLNGRWSGRGKGLTRALRDFDQQTSAAFFDALRRYYREGDKQPLVAFVEECYKPLGGRLFDGFSQGKP